jgi:metal-responsive CopG/Arc/MetJ family transcriptional regulator
MAKFTVSMPDELLARVDAEAQRRGTSRSGVIRELTSAAFDERSARLAARMRELDGQATSHGGDVVKELKAGRPT